MFQNGQHCGDRHWTCVLTTCQETLTDTDTSNNNNIAGTRRNNTTFLSFTPPAAKRKRQHSRAETPRNSSDAPSKSHRPVRPNHQPLGFREAFHQSSLVAHFVFVALLFFIFTLFFIIFVIFVFSWWQEAP